MLPGDFIALAEETGLIADIGAWVLRRACADAATWNRQWPGRDIGVAVNVSGRQLVQGPRRRPRSTPRSPRRVCEMRLLTLELTESSLIDDAIGVRDILGQLRERGVRVAIDDFGTGYSSLTYLRELPIDEIKIDRSFIARIAHDRSDAAIAAAVARARRQPRSRSHRRRGRNPRSSSPRSPRSDADERQGYLFAPPCRSSRSTRSSAAHRSAGPRLPGAPERHPIDPEARLGP